MEPLDREIAKALGEPPRVRRGPARILLVGDRAGHLESVASALQRISHRCDHVERLESAKGKVARHRFDVIMVSALLPDGDGLELLSVVQKTCPSTKTLVLAPAGNPQLAIDAMRRGAVDLVDLRSCPEAEMLERVDVALMKARLDQDRERRLVRLKRICRELNVARREVTQQVDVLCDDLATAYQEVTEQLNDVAMSTEFRTLIKQELDIEDLLRTTLEYLLSKTGPTNAAVFLPDQDGHFDLGAYVNYDCPRQTIAVLLDHLCQAICPQMAQESDIVTFDDAAQFAEWIGLDAGTLDDSQVLAFSCPHEGECLAVVVLFRSRSEPFDESVASTLDILRHTFADQLDQVIRIHNRARPQWPEEASDEDPELDDYGFGYEGGLAA